MTVFPDKTIGAIIRIYSWNRSYLSQIREGFCELHDQHPSQSPIKTTIENGAVYVLEHTRHGNLDVIGWLHMAASDLEDIVPDTTQETITVSIELIKERNDSA